MLPLAPTTDLCANSVIQDRIRRRYTHAVYPVKQLTKFTTSDLEVGAKEGMRTDMD